MKGYLSIVTIGLYWVIMVALDKRYLWKISINDYDSLVTTMFITLVHWTDKDKVELWEGYVKQ